MSRYINNNFLTSTFNKISNNIIYSGNILVNMKSSFFRKRKWKYKYFELDLNKNIIYLWNPKKLKKFPKKIKNIFIYNITLNYDYINNVQMCLLNFKFKKNFIKFASENTDFINIFYKYLTCYNYDKL